MNPADLFKFRGNWQKFVQNHPKVKLKSSDIDMINDFKKMASK